MEILTLVLFYYLSQNADFAASVKPLMEQIKDSEQMLKFLNDLSQFSKTFSGFTTPPPPQSEPAPAQKQEPAPEKENPQSPTSKIADEFIQSILDSYLKKN